MKLNKTVLALAVAMCVPAFTACTAANAGNSDSSVMTRAALGDITQYAGARRLTGDMTDNYQAVLDLAKKKHAKNVILLIGDGMGDSEITAARNFAKGAGGMFEGLDSLPFTGQYTHYSLNKETKKPNYVTDSAASATAWSTGVKSYNGAIGVDVNGKPHVTLLELAKAKGLATGDVSTAEIEDATPAAQIAHVVARKCYGPKKTSELCPENALENGGKGAACLSGFRAAAKRGFTHVLQVDADAQHDLSEIPNFLRVALNDPKSLVCGYPIYDETVPKARLFGRKITNFWVAVNGLTLGVEDAMCGLRVYPVAALERLRGVRMGQRMDFDPEILVRLLWLPVTVRNVPVHVTYPEDSVSHFDMVEDNVRISLMHARLCCGMLLRLPVLLVRKLRHALSGADS